MTDYTPPKVTVNSNPLPDIIGANLRYALTALGGWVTQHGWIMGETWTTITGAIMAAAPWVYGVILTYINKQKQLKLATTDIRHIEIK